MGGVGEQVSTNPKSHLAKTAVMESAWLLVRPDGFKMNYERTVQYKPRPKLLGYFHTSVADGFSDPSHVRRNVAIFARTDEIKFGNRAALFAERVNSLLIDGLRLRCNSHNHPC